MHSFARRLHRKAAISPATPTRGLILDQGWRYDLGIWFMDTFLFRRQLHYLRARTLDQALLQPGDAVLDVGCGTGILALSASRRVGLGGRVVGIDPASQQIAHARVMARSRNLPVEFEIGVIEHLPFPDRTFDVVLSTLMMHHLPGSLKRLGLTEIARVLKADGRLVIADFTKKQERTGQSRRFHAGGSRLPDLAALVSEAGFERVATEEMLPSRFSLFPGAGLLRASTHADSRTKNGGEEHV